MAVELAERTYHETRDPPYQKLKASRKPRLPAYLLPEPAANGSMELDRELRAAKKERAKQEGRFRVKEFSPSFNCSKLTELNMRLKS